MDASATETQRFHQFLALMMAQVEEILVLVTTHWELVIRCGKLDQQQARLDKTLAVRHKSLPGSRLTFSRALAVTEVTEQGRAYCPLPEPLLELPLARPLFFENTHYDFQWVFFDPPAGSDVSVPEVRHALAAVNTAFYFSSRHGINELHGGINFANDIGWFRLPLRYTVNGQRIDLTLSFEVLPLKLDMAADLDRIYHTLDHYYPLWRFTLVAKTEQSLLRSDAPHASFSLLWLAQFESLRDALDEAMRLILHAPHSRLLDKPRRVRAQRLRGRTPTRLAQRIREDIRAGQANRRYRVTQQQLSLDTPENRFIKMVLDSSHDKLGRFAEAAKKQDDQGGRRLSAAFFDRLQQWQLPLESYRNHALFKEVGAFTGLGKASMVLEQKPGYARVYRIWQLLSRYLDVLGRQATIAMKSVAALYQNWCFLMLKLLLEEIGFTEVQRQAARLVHRGLELRTVYGECGGFVFTREDGLILELIHEPLFGEGSRPVRSWNCDYRPDILLQVTFPRGDTLMWLFDAKYRLSERAGVDQAPTAALNQMHSYRNALLHLHEELFETEKSRPVLGAFVLYPGVFADQSADNLTDNPYHEGNSITGIGAFPLTPGQAGGHGWLATFLATKFAEMKYKGEASVELLSITEPMRIPTTGMQQLRYSDVCLLVSSAEDPRAAGYYQGFADGSARWFHMRLEASDRQRINRHAIREIHHCVIAGLGPDGGRQGLWMWTVYSVHQMRRRDLTLAQAGKKVFSDIPYWVFELGMPRRLEVPLEGFAPGHHHMKLTRLAWLDDMRHFEAVRDVYPWLSSGI